jgi:hypothetical protein
MTGNSGQTETMQTVVPKPKRGGRPATGRDPLVQVRMPADLIQAIDRFAGKFCGPQPLAGNPRADRAGASRRPQEKCGGRSEALQAARTQDAAGEAPTAAARGLCTAAAACPKGVVNGRRK